MGVSKNRGGPQIIHFNRVFHYIWVFPKIGVEYVLGGSSQVS